MVVCDDSQSATGQRARFLLGALSKRNDIQVAYSYRRGRREVRALEVLLHFLQYRPNLIYLIDTGVFEVLGVAIYTSLVGCRTAIITDTGDVAYQLAESTGRPRLAGARRAIKSAENWALTHATTVVVRGTYHVPIVRRHRPGPIEIVFDGADVTGTAPIGLEQSASERASLGLTHDFVVGVVGSLVWNRRNRTCYGSAVLEAIRLVRPDVPMHALIVGDGDGLQHLRNRARDLGVDDRVTFTGRLPPERTLRAIAAFDVAVSTQTGDAVGWARTTGKLVAYMAAARYVIASDVGEARNVLPPQMRVPYNGAFDPGYAAKLARALEHAFDIGPAARASAGTQLRQVASVRFDYRVLAAKAERVVLDTIGARSRE